MKSILWYEITGALLLLLFYKHKARREMDFMQARAEDQRLRGKGPLIVRLVESDLHKTPGLFKEWWGRRIIVSQPLKPRDTHACNPEYVYRILGPPDFIELLHSLGRYDRYACEHCIQWIFE